MDMTWLEKLAGAEGWIGLGLLTLLVLLLLIFIIRFSRFAKKCEQKGVAFYFVTSKSSADYESASDIKDKIIYNSTLENAYAKNLLSGK